MENEKKKRKNKKKKNKPIRASEDEAIVSESTSVDDNHQNPISDTLPLSHHHSTGPKDAVLEETIEHLRKESLLLAHDKAKLENTIQHLNEENNVHIQKMADLELKLEEFQGEKQSRLQKEATLVDTIRRLQEGKTALDLEVATLVDTIRRLQEGKTALDLEVARLLHTIEQLDRDKAALILNENSSREMIVGTNKDIFRLQAQVVELEEQIRDLLQENKQLTENVADYQSKILNLERSVSSTNTHFSDRVTKEMLSSQVDAARILVDKLITENAELIGKVNELFVELQRVTKTELASGMERDQTVEATDTATSNNPERILIQNNVISSTSLDSLESVPIHNRSVGGNIMDLDNELLARTSLIPMVAGEIQQITLHENEDAESDETDVLLSDAPLIGAPFRLISFMAKYVSGADLVAES